MIIVHCTKVTCAHREVVIVGNRFWRSGVLALLGIMADNWDRFSEYE
jgi:hypothetical protein